MVGRYGPQVTRQAASPEDCRVAALTIVVDIEETPRARLQALNQVAVDPIGQCACQQLLDSRRTVEVPLAPAAATSAQSRLAGPTAPHHLANQHRT